MSDEKDTKLFGGEVDRELVELAEERLEYGEKSEVIRHLVETIAYEGWQESTPYDSRIKKLEHDLSRLREKRERITTKIEDKEDELETLRRKRDEAQSTEDQLQGAIVTLEADLRTGANIFPGHGSVQTIAKDLEVDPERIISRLKDRNPDVPDYAFKKHMHSPKSWDGVDAGEVDTPPASRERVYRDPD